MVIPANKMYKLVLVFALIVGCDSSSKYKEEEKQFYHAYKGADYIFIVEAEFIQEHTYFSIYTPGKIKVFEKK